MSQQQEVQVRDEDMKSLAEKMNAFQKTLSPAEAAILQTQFADADEGEDVAGYVYVNPNGSAGVRVSTPFGGKTYGASRQTGARVVFQKGALGFSVTNR